MKCESVAFSAMPRTEIEFEFDSVLAYVWHRMLFFFFFFPIGFTFNILHDLLKMIVL